MIIKIKDINNPPAQLNNCCLCFGVFDGLHSGHRFEFEQAKLESIKHKTSSGILTFDIDPDELYTNNFVKLMSNKKRIMALDDTGCNYVFVLNYKQIRKYTAHEFLDAAFGVFKPCSIHVGNNIRFGYKAKGDSSLLKLWGKENSVLIYINELITKDDHIESSTYYRNLLKLQKKL